jgi:uncharacterized protein (TIGR03435 family)
MSFKQGLSRIWMIRVSSLAALIMSNFGFAQKQAVVPAVGPTFEVATVKPNTRGGGPYAQILPGRLMMTYYSVQDLVAFAYGLRAEQVAGKSFADRYDIEATTDGKTPANQMTGPMLQALLEDRFKLKFHRETQQLPVYELTVAKSGVKLPPAKEGDCTPFASNAAPLPKPAPGEVRPPVFFCGYPRTGAIGLKRTLEGKGVSLDALAESLSSSELNRTVLNKTGLTGRFNLNLRWAIDPTIPGLDDNLGGARVPDTDMEPTIFNALQEQLGLKLESGRGPVEVLVIDQVEKPSPN